MDSFSGDISFIANNELNGVKSGHPYCTGSGHSGINLIIGVDLSIFHYRTVLGAYGSVLTNNQISSLVMCSSMKGQMALNFLQADRYLKTIKIPFDLAVNCFPIFAERSWSRLVKHWPDILDAPAEVQTAVFDVTFSRGVHNTHVQEVGKYLSEQNWKELSLLIGGMQQRSAPATISSRRTEAAKLIS